MKIFYFENFTYSFRDAAAQMTINSYTHSVSEMSIHINPIRANPEVFFGGTKTIAFFFFSLHFGLHACRVIMPSQGQKLTGFLGQNEKKLAEICSMESQFLSTLFELLNLAIFKPALTFFLLIFVSQYGSLLLKSAQV